MEQRKKQKAILNTKQQIWSWWSANEGKKTDYGEEGENTDPHYPGAQSNGACLQFLMGGYNRSMNLKPIWCNKSFFVPPASSQIPTWRFINYENLIIV